MSVPASWRHCVGEGEPVREGWRGLLGPLVHGSAAAALLEESAQHLTSGTIEGEELVLRFRSRIDDDPLVLRLFPPEQAPPEVDGLTVPDGLRSFMSVASDWILGSESHPDPQIALDVGDSVEGTGWEHLDPHRDRFLMFRYYNSDLTGFHHDWKDASGDPVIVTICHDEEFEGPRTDELKRTGFAHYFLQRLQEEIGTVEEAFHARSRRLWGEERGEFVASQLHLLRGEQELRRAYHAGRELYKKGELAGFFKIVLAFARHRPDARADADDSTWLTLLGEEPLRGSRQDEAMEERARQYATWMVKRLRSADAASLQGTARELAAALVREQLDPSAWDLIEVITSDRDRLARRVDRALFRRIKELGPTALDEVAADVLECLPESAVARQVTTKKLLNRGAFEEAFATSSGWLASGEPDPVLLDHCVLAALKTGRPEVAIERFAAAVESKKIREATTFTATLGNVYVAYAMADRVSDCRQDLDPYLRPDYEPTEANHRLLSNAACLHALDSDTEGAVALARRAIELGRPISYFETEPDFDEVRESPAYAELRAWAKSR